jgi:LPXTG-motif cell wall-anchored protein
MGRHSKPSGGGQNPGRSLAAISGILALIGLVLIRRRRR